MKNYEKQSFFTAFYLFFITLITFSSIVLYMYYKDRVEVMEQKILYQMKDYTFDFSGDAFVLDIIEKDENKKLFMIYRCEEGLCAYFQIPTTGPYLLKVIYPKEKLEKSNESILREIFKLFGFCFVFVLFISVGFSFYSIRPMKNALKLLEEFLKDLIHDLNTPASSILLNSKLLRKRGDFEEIERIELSASIISSLHKNLQILKSEKIIKDELVKVDVLVNEKIEILKKLYPRISIESQMEPLEIKSNKNALSRIIDNLLTNACKYNKKNGTVLVKIEKNSLHVEDTGIGIKDTKKVFDRYYKENERGLGIGLNIVKQLCESLKIDISIKSQIGKGTTVSLILN